MSGHVQDALLASDDPHPEPDPVRQAINSIYAWAKLLRSGVLSPEQCASAITAIEHNADFILKRWTGDDETLELAARKRS